VHWVAAIAFQVWQLYQALLGTMVAKNNECGRLGSTLDQITSNKIPHEILLISWFSAQFKLYHTCFTVPQQIELVIFEKTSLWDHDIYKNGLHTMKYLKIRS
jgi:hypothetical protein